MKILILTTLFPNSQQPNRGVFVSEMVKELKKYCKIEIVAPVPYFPRIRIFQTWYKYSLIKACEIKNGMSIYHPKYLAIPKILKFTEGLFLFIALYLFYLSHKKIFQTNLIQTHFAFPDAFAAVRMGRLLGIPTVTTIHGSDINIYTRNPFRRKLVIFTLRHSQKIISVCNYLKIQTKKLGIADKKVTTILNGVAISKFKPIEKNETRKKLGLPQEKQIVLYIGNLERIKGIPYLLEAINTMKKEKILLVIIGAGKLKDELIHKVKTLHLQEKVKFLGQIPHSAVPLWLNGCDLLCLPSLSEGLPTVILEALACGIPVVASQVGGIPELVSPECGILIPPSSPEKLATAISEALCKKWNRNKIISLARNLAWSKVARQIYKIYRDAIL